MSETDVRVDRLEEDMTAVVSRVQRVVDDCHTTNTRVTVQHEVLTRVESKVDDLAKAVAQGFADVIARQDKTNGRVRTLEIFAGVAKITAGGLVAIIPAVWAIGPDKIIALFVR